MELLAPLSVGGMGEVHLARRKGAHGFEKLIALKTIRHDLVEHQEMRRMFLDEARLLARLDHPAVAQVYDFVEQKGQLYLSMEYVPGIPISKLMQKRKEALPPGVVARIGVEVSRGLHAAHELTDLDGKQLGVVHRDVSPQNLMLTFDGRMKILDFGVAYMFDREATTTQTGLFKGKLAYISPEQITGEGIDRASDVYSLSVVLHELLTGRRLFAKSGTPLSEAIRRRDVATPSSINPDVPKRLDDAVMKGLEIRPSKRYKDARELAAALEEYLAEAGGESLEAFAERELETERRAHQAWIQSVADGPSTATDETEPEQTRAERPESLGTDDSSEVDLASFEPEPPRRSGAFLGLAIILGALGVGAWLLFPNQVEDNARNLAGKVEQEARPLIASFSEPPPEVPVDEAVVDRVEAERIEEDDTEDPSDSSGSADTPELAEASASDASLEPEAPAEPAEATESPDAGPSQSDASVEATEAEPTPPIPKPITQAPPPKAAAPPPPPPPRKKVVRVKKRPPPKKVVRTRRRTSRRHRYGSLSIIARPGGTILVDGRRAGRTPLKRRRLRTGKHRVALIRRGDRRPRWTSTVWIHEGKHVRIRLR